jgi:PAS domain S-box-containing protein
LCSEAGFKTFDVPQGNNMNLQRNNRSATKFVYAASAVVASFGLLSLLGWITPIRWLATFWSGGIPMAPSTSLFFVLYGVAIPVRLSSLEGWRIRLARVCGWIGMLFSGFLFLLSLRGIHLNTEHLGLAISGMVVGSPIGYMSPMTAMCFLLAGCSFLLLSNNRRGRTLVSFWLAVIVFLSAMVLVIGYLVGAPLFYGTETIPPAMTTSLAFLMLGLALAWSAGSFLWTRGAQDIDNGGRQTTILVLVFLLLVTGILGAGHLSSRRQQKNYRDRVNIELSAIADLKTNQINQWRKERLADGELFVKNSAFSKLVKRYLDHQDDTGVREQIGAWLGRMATHAQYRKIFLVDTKGVKRLVLPDGQEAGTILDDMGNVQALAIRRLSFLDFHRDKPDGPEHLDLVVPIYAEPDWQELLGYLIIEIDPDVYLFPLIQTWPTPSTSAETLLVRREGQDVLFLNNLRFRENAALSLRLPLSRIDLPAAKAVLGQTGVVAGIDYRGVPVFAALRAIPDSPWYLIARMDKEEIYEPLREHLLKTSGLILAVLLGAGAAVGFIWRHQRAGFYRLQFDAMREANESGRRLRLVFENTKDGIMVADIETKHVIMANKAVCEMLGYDYAEILTLTVDDFHPAENLPAILQTFELQVHGDLSFAAAVPMQRKDSTVFYADINTTLMELQGRSCILGTFRDITERIQNEARIEHLNRVLRAIRNINQLIVRAKFVDELINKACMLLVDHKSYASALIIITDEAGVPLSHAEAGTGEGFRVLVDRIEAGELPLCCVAAKETTGVCLLCGTDDVCKPCPIGSICVSPQKMSIRLEHQGKIFGYLAVTIDDKVTMDHEEESLFIELAGDLAYSLHNMEIQRVMQQGEEERKKLEAQFFQAQKMESVGRLAGGIAHDFNNLLSIIIGYAELLADDQGGLISKQEATGEIYNAAIRAKNLTQQLLAFSRKQILEMDVVDINKVITGFEKLLRRTIGEDIQVAIDLAHAPFLVKADTSQIEQVLLNLAVNARDAMPDGGNLTIETLRVELDETYAAQKPGVIPGPYAMISISDSGTGMDQETMKWIFEPFYTTKSLDKGTGLGLSTVYGIVKQHGGNIWVYSEIGGGTTFKIYLPLVNEEPESNGQSKEISLPPAESITVMVVEDEVALRKLVRKILERHGYKVLEVGDVDDTLEIVSRSTDPVRLLLTDVIMPKMKGTEVFKQIQAVVPDIKVLYMSGYTDNVIVRQGILKEGVQFIQKPFTAASLLGKIAEVFKS